MVGESINIFSNRCYNFLFIYIYNSDLSEFMLLCLDEERYNFIFFLHDFLFNPTLLTKKPILSLLYESAPLSYIKFLHPLGSISVPLIFLCIHVPIPPCLN